MKVVPASIASRAEFLAASGVQAAFSGSLEISSVIHLENEPPSGSSPLRNPRCAWAFTAPGVIVWRGKRRTSAPGLSRSISESWPTAAMRSFSTSKAPSLIGWVETGRTRSAAKITGRGAGAVNWTSSLYILDRHTGLQDPIVECGALGRPEAAPLDDAPELLLGGAVLRPRLFDDVLLDHYRTHVVAPGVQRYRGGLHRLGDPTGLDVRHVVEDDAAYGRGLQVIQRGRLLEVRVLLQVGRVVRLEGPVDKCRKTAGPGLKRPDLQQVLDPLLVGLVDPEHHRRRGLHS